MWGLAFGCWGPHSEQGAWGWLPPLLGPRLLFTEPPAAPAVSVPSPNSGHGLGVKVPATAAARASPLPTPSLALPPLGQGGEKGA